jgi:hypothetical protein
MASGPVFMFYVPGLIYGGSMDVSWRFHVLRTQTRFRRYGGRQPLFSCFGLSDSFSAAPRATGPVYMFCAPGLISGGTEGDGSSFQVLRSRTSFRRYPGRWVQFSCFALPDSFSAIPRASGHVFMFCVFGLIFGSTKGVGSIFHVLRYRTRFRWYRGRWVPFTRFAFSDSFLAVKRASGPICTFCVPGLIFDGTKGVVSRFHVLRSKTRFRRYRVLRVLFSCFALPNSFLAVPRAVPRASGQVFYVLRARLFFGGNEGVEFRFCVLRSRTRLRRFHGRRVPFSCFARPNSFLTGPRASDPVFMFSAPRYVFGGVEAVSSYVHVLRSRTRFRRYRGRRGPVFRVLRYRTHLRQFRGQRVPFSCFAH